VNTILALGAASLVALAAAAFKLYMLGLPNICQ
jgi:hypothetical protein